MELSVLLVFLLGCSLSWASPILKKDIAEDNNSANPSPIDDNLPIFDIISKQNKDLPFLLEDGDIRPENSRSLRQCPGCLWEKSANGIVQVPYKLDPLYGEFDAYMFSFVMKEFEVMTCVQFVNRTTEDNYLMIHPGAGCWSYVGKIGGAQQISLAVPDCIKYNLMQHELMHALGFYHEQTRNDRDKYIDIFWENIAPGSSSAFNLDGGDTQNLPYGFNSVMHYGASAYSGNGRPTMLAKSNPNMTLGQFVGINDIDIMKVNKAYDCNLCRKKFLGYAGNFTYDSTTSRQGGSSCLYLMQTNFKVLLQISDLNIPSSPNCNDAYIKVYDGVSQSSPVLLEKTCGSEPIPPLTSSDQLMLIEIVSTQPSYQITFDASYKTMRYGGTYVTDNGNVKSPLFPNMYPRNTDVVYTIIAPKGYKVSLSFKLFSVRFSSGCTEEYLLIRDGALDTSPSLGQYCYNPPTVVSSGNVMVLYFHSGDIAAHNGFIAPYKFVPIN